MTIDRVTVLGKLAATADADADRLLARAADLADVANQSLRRSATADALAMLELADRLRNRSTIEAAKAAPAAAEPVV